MPRGEMIVVRVSDAEKTWFRDAAESERVTLGEWLRRIAILRAAEIVGRPTEPRQAA